MKNNTSDTVRIRKQYNEKKKEIEKGLDSIIWGTKAANIGLGFI